MSDPTPTAKANGKIVIIGAGISGLCAAVYARTVGYDVEVIEQSHGAGGLAVNWRRGDYVFENCLYFLTGSKPGGWLNAQWNEVCDMSQLTFVDHEEFIRLEDQSGRSLGFSSKVDQLESDLLQAAPEDAEEIGHFIAAVRHLAAMPVPSPGDSLTSLFGDVLKILPEIPLLWRLMRTTVNDYAKRFKHPLLRRFFTDDTNSNLCVIGVALSCAWMTNGNAGYALGGSQALIQAILTNLTGLGGSVRFGARVARICVADDRATGVELADGEIIEADWVISAADAHTTLHQLLDGHYPDKSYAKAFAKYETFPSYVLVSLGIDRDLSGEPNYLSLILDTPFSLDPDTSLNAISFRFFNFDPAMAPEGKTAVTCFLPTRNLSYWQELRTRNPEAYHAEKDRLATAVITILDQRITGIKSDIEVVDVATPATVARMTGNWRGSMEGWLMTPESGFGALPQHLAGLSRFRMIGQWTQPGGGLPNGLMNGRSCLQAICHHDGVPFMTAMSH